MGKEIINEPNLEKIREIILEPDLGLLANRVAKLEKLTSGTDSSTLDQVKNDVTNLKNDMAAIRKEIEEIQTVIVALNRKLANAFGSFIKPSD